MLNILTRLWAASAATFFHSFNPPENKHFRPWNKIQNIYRYWNIKLEDKFSGNRGGAFEEETADC
jgi:hypothetical protein